MATLRFRLPDIGEGVAEAEVVAWLVEPGDRVTEDQPVVEVTTDKATVTIGAPAVGQVTELCCKVGDSAKVGEVLFVLDREGSSDAPEEATIRGIGSRETLQSDRAPNGGHSQAPVATEATASAVGDLRASLPGVGLRHAATAAAAESGAAVRMLATPAVRQLVRELKLSEQAVCERFGVRVTKAQVLSLALEVEAQRTGEVRLPEAPQPSATPSAAPAQDTRVPFVGVRRTIANRMRASLARAAHATFVEECRADALLALRTRLNEGVAPEARMSFLPLLAKCVAAVLRQHPMLNASLDDDARELTLHGGVHLGIATATPQGLVVPVIRHAEQRSVPELHTCISELAARARDGKLLPAELSGSTFTITSLGKVGGLHATPILNPPEVGILGVHRIRDAAVVEQGVIKAGKVMSLSLSFDHCVVDGLDAANFVYDLIARLEAPERLLLDLR